MNSTAFATGAAITVALLATSPAVAQLRITEVMPQASSGTSSDANGDWWELTNFGSAPVDLAGYQWADLEDALPSTDSNFFPSYILNPGQSLVILEERAEDKAGWRSVWGISAAVAILGEDEMLDDSTPDGDTFSGLNSGGETVFFYDPSGVLLDSYSFAGDQFVRGVSFEANGNGDNLGRSVVGEFDAILAGNGDIGSPGVAVVPEPATLSLGLVAGGLLLARRRGN
jgi:hypothetical protein